MEHNKKCQEENDEDVWSILNNICGPIVLLFVGIELFNVLMFFNIDFYVAFILTFNFFVALSQEIEKKIMCYWPKHKYNNSLSQHN